MLTRLDLYGEWLRSDPAGFALYMVYFVAAVLVSLILHECAHGYVAYRCGDPTAKMMGRLSLDPRRHLDLMGTICMFALGFGWAKPVPVDPRNFRDPRRDDFLVSIAGITVNLTLFVLCTGLTVAVNRLMVGGAFYAEWSGSMADKQRLLSLNEAIAQGGTVTIGGVPANDLFMQGMTAPWLRYVLQFLVMMRQINLSLAVFNLLPVPPLDGFRLLNNLLRGRLRMTMRVYRVFQAGLLLLCLSGALGRVLGVVTGALDDAVTHLFLLL